MSTIFKKIIDKEIPCFKVAEDEQFLAFLDINPNAKGHTLCIPKIETDDILDLDKETYKNLRLFSRKVAKSIKDVIQCKKIAISVIGLEVPHVHVHLIPINDMKDANFSKKVNLTNDDLVLSTHRSHAHYLAKNGNLNKMIAEIYGKSSGCSSGKGGSMHLIDTSVGFMGSTAIVGNTIPLGVGLGLSIKLKNEKNISCVFFW